MSLICVFIGGFFIGKDSEMGRANEVIEIAQKAQLNAIDAQKRAAKMQESAVEVIKHVNEYKEVLAKKCGEK